MPVPVRGAKQRTVLALLALHRGQPVSADRLIDALWGDGQVANPVNALQAQIGQLRRTLGATAILTSDAGYALDIGPDDVDAARFEQLVAKGRRLFEEGEMALASTALGEALRLRRGEPLTEFADAGFADAERAHLAELTLVAIETRAEADLVLGRHGELVGELEALCREHPLRERLRELLMLALYRAGRQAEALRAYTDARDYLVDELGIDPGPALRELEARILAQDPSLGAAGPAGLEAVPAPMATGNLRERLSSFVGRTAELGELGEAVRSSRLVTLIGPGGVGKTRLAVEAAATLRDEHRDGAWLVEFASVTGPDGVAPAVAGALGAAAAGLIGPPSPDSTVELIVRYLAGRSLLVVFDNCEHVIDQAAALASHPSPHPRAQSVSPSRWPWSVRYEPANANTDQATATPGAGASGRRADRQRQYRANLVRGHGFLTAGRRATPATVRADAAGNDQQPRSSRSPGDRGVPAALFPADQPPRPLLRRRPGIPARAHPRRRREVCRCTRQPGDPYLAGACSWPA